MAEELTQAERELIERHRKNAADNERREREFAALKAQRAARQHELAERFSGQPAALAVISQHGCNEWGYCSEQTCQSYDDQNQWPCPTITVILETEDIHECDSDDCSHLYCCWWREDEDRNSRDGGSDD